MFVEMVPVQSSNVECVGYDDGAAELHVRFLTSATTYVYQGVPPDLHEALMAAVSKGTFMNTVIKPGYSFYCI